MASGDTLYVGAGVYRESVQVTLTPAAATYVIADVDGSQTGDVGEVRWTAYTTNDRSAPASTATLRLNGKPHLNFRNIVFVGGSHSTYACVDADTIKGSDNCSFTDCTFLPGSNSGATMITWQLNHDGGFPPAGSACNLTIDRCRFLLSDSMRGIVIKGSSLASDFNYNILIQNCLFVGSRVRDDGFEFSGDGVIAIQGSAYGIDGSAKPGGFKIYSNTCISAGTFLSVYDCASSSYALQTHPYNNVLVGCNITTNNGPSVQEDYNLILTSQTATSSGVQRGGRSKTDGTYSMLLHMGQEIPQGKAQRHFAQPTVDSPILGFGGLSLPTYDITNGLRPAGSRNSSTSSYAIGCIEHFNNGVKDTSVIRSSPSSLKIAGPGYHDFDFPVDPVQTTIGVHSYRDTNYAGTNPQIMVVNGTEAGVANATATAAGAANSWNQITLTFTPTAKGIVTIRLVSNDTSTNGNCYFDDFTVT